MPSTNLRHELERAQLELKQQELLREAMDILEHEVDAEKSVSSRIKFKKTVDSVLNQLLDEEHIFDLSAILQICKTHGLKFTNSTNFKGDIPPEAIRSIKRIESTTGLNFKKFNLITARYKYSFPTKKRNPMLFAELPNGRHLFIMEWENKVNPIMDILKNPFNHLGKITLASIVIGIGLSLLVPAIFDDWKAEFFYRFFVFNIASTAIVIIAMVLGAVLSKDFGQNYWNNKF